MNKVYKASFDTLAKGITLCSILLFTVISVAMFGLFISDSNNKLLVALAVTGLLTCIVILCWLYHPQKYIINEKELRIHRPAKGKVIDRAEIQYVRLLDKADLRGTIRTFGNGGLFGYFGKFWNSKIGTMTWYVTQRRNYVLVTTAQSKILLTPDNVTLAEELRS